MERVTDAEVEACVASLVKPVLQSGFLGIWKHRLQGPHVKGGCSAKSGKLNWDLCGEDSWDGT